VWLSALRCCVVAGRSRGGCGAVAVVVRSLVDWKGEARSRAVQSPERATIRAVRGAKRLEANGLAV